MKKLLLLLIICTTSFQSFGQDPDPDLFQTWYLVTYTYDLAGIYHVADVQPYISVEFILDENLEFTGIVCNEYGGAYSYDAPNDMLILDMFSPCLCGTCNNPPQSHIDLENDYWGYFNEGFSYEYELMNNGTELRLSAEVSTDLFFQNTPLTFGVEEQNLAAVKLFPNPVSEMLFIATDGQPIEHVSVYTISGKRIISETSTTNQLDVSGLKAGLYFAEIGTSEGKSVQKFMKK